MAIVTMTVTINAAFLREIKDDNRRLGELLDELRGRCSATEHQAVDPGSLASLLAQLRDQLALHFSLEEAYGYFEDPVAVAPRLCRRAKSLRDQHQTLFMQICEMVEYAERWQYHEIRQQALERIAIRFLTFEQQLREHESLENDLIQQAYSDDIGVGD